MISYRPILSVDSLYSRTSDSSSPISIANSSGRKAGSESVILTKGSSSDRSYIISVPSCVNVLSSAFNNLRYLSNESVKRQTLRLLVAFQSKLDQINKNNNLPNRLPALSLIEREDKSALIEWNFENYRIGFAIEEDAKESNFFIVSQDRDVQRFLAETYLLGENYEAVVSSLISYVIRNS